MELEIKIQRLQEAIELASNSLAQAKLILFEITWESIGNKKIEQLKKTTASITTLDTNDENIVEWVFDWEKMIDTDWFSHPIPANYISKSKLVEWDWLKLTVTPDWRFLYKQIRPVLKKHIIWTLSKEKEQYVVIAEWKVYKVILAAVTYLKAGIWDRISIIVPDHWNSEWAAVDALVPY